MVDLLDWSKSSSNRLAEERRTYSTVRLHSCSQPEPEWSRFLGRLMLHVPFIH